jgi:hypothetical protein
MSTEPKSLDKDSNVLGAVEYVSIVEENALSFLVSMDAVKFMRDRSALQDTLESGTMDSFLAAKASRYFLL